MGNDMRIDMTDKNLVTRLYNPFEMICKFAHFANEIFNCMILFYLFSAQLTIRELRCKWFRNVFNNDGLV